MSLTASPVWLDETHSAERCALLRYFSLLGSPADFPPPTRDDLARTSLGAEGMAVRELGGYKGVSLCALDLSSHTRTGTVKALSACYIAAGYARRAEKALVILSSGNKANSLRVYAAARGITVVSFVPRSGLAKLRGALPGGAGRDIVVLSDATSDEAMKTFGRRVAALLGLPCQPALADYAAADRARAGAYAEALWRGSKPCTHFFQPVSSNYGLYGAYLGLEDVAERGTLPGGFPIPVGVQQEAIAPLFDVFERGVAPEKAFAVAAAGYRGGGVLERTLFTTAPATLAENRWLKDRFGARFLTVSADEMRRYYARARLLLEEGGVALPADLTALEEKSGVMGLVAVLRAVDSGWLADGARVMVHFTGGVEKLPALGSGTAVMELEMISGKEEAAADALRALLKVES